MASTNGQDQWPKEDIEMLLDLVENNLPPNDSHTFKKTQSMVDWGKVAFKDHSGEMCKLKWLEISNQTRKFRILTEIVQDTKEHLKTFYQRKKLKNHPHLPKKPLTAYFRFFREKRAQYSQMHPEMNDKKLTKVLSKKYKELPEQMKPKYIQDFQNDKEEFEEKMTQFRKDHPDLNKKSNPFVVPKRCSTKVQKKLQTNVETVKSPSENYFSEKVKFHGEPKKPPMNEYHKFHQDLWSSRELQDLPMREHMVEIGRRWQRVPLSQKQHYKKQAEELQKQYKVDLDHWLSSLSPEEYAAYRERSYAKHKNMNMNGGLDPKIMRKEVLCPSARALPERIAQKHGPQTPETESARSRRARTHVSQKPEENKEDGEKAESSSSSDSSSGDEDEDCEDSSCSSSSSGVTSDSDSN